MTSTLQARRAPAEGTGEPNVRSDYGTVNCATSTGPERTPDPKSEPGTGKLLPAQRLGPDLLCKAGASVSASPPPTWRELPALLSSPSGSLKRF